MTDAAPTPQEATLSRRIVEVLLPTSIAVSQFGAVVQAQIPSIVSDAFVVLTLLFAVLLTATFRKLPPGLLLLALLGVVAAGLSQRPNLFVVALIPLIVFTLKYLEIQRVMRIFVLVSALLLGVVVGAYFISGFNSDFDIYMWREYNQSWVERQSLGFTHPNRAMPAWAILSIGVLAISAARGRLLWFLPLTAVTVYFYSATDSRSSTILLALLLLVFFFGRKKIDQPVSRLISIVAISAPIALTIASFGLSVLSANEEVNSLLSGRPAIYASLLKNYSAFLPFGNLAIESEIVDSGYIQLVLGKGLLLAAVYLVTLTSVIARARISWRSFFILGAFLLLSLAETALLNLPFLFLVLSSLELDRRGSLSAVEVGLQPTGAQGPRLSSKYQEFST